MTCCVFLGLSPRASLPVRNPEGKIRLYCKGADTILLDRLHPSTQELLNTTTDHLNDLDEEYYEEWADRRLQASLALDNREDRLASVYEEIESDMMVQAMEGPRVGEGGSCLGLSCQGPVGYFSC